MREDETTFRGPVAWVPSAEDTFIVQGVVNGRIGFYLYRNGQRNLILKDGESVPGDPTKTFQLHPPASQRFVPHLQREAIQ